MSNIKNLGDLSINIPKNLEKVDNVIIEKMETNSSNTA